VRGSATAVAGSPPVEATRAEPDGRWRSSRGDVRSFAWAVVACTAAAGVLAWYRIGHDSFWLDEAASLRFVRDTSWTGILTESNGNMPVYLGFLKLWVPYAKSEATVRALSTIPFVLTVPVVALIGRRIGGYRVGLLAAAIVATHPLLVRYGQEARSFSLVTCLTATGVFAFIAGVQDRNARMLLAGVILLAIAPYAHPVAGLTALALLVWLWWLPAQALPVDRRWALGIFGVIVAPLALVLARAGSSSLSWTGRGRHGGVASLLSVVWQNASGTLAGLIVAGGAAAGCVLAAAIIRRNGRTVDSWVAGVPIVWVLGTGILVLLVSLRQSLLVPRYALLVVPGVALLAASVTVRTTWSKLAAVLLVSAALFNAGVTVERGGAYRPEDWREAQAFVASGAAPGDGIVFAPTAKAVSYEYYQVRASGTIPDPVLPSGRWGHIHVDFARFVRDRPADLVASLRTSRHDRMWLVVAAGPGGQPSARFLQASRDALATTGTREGSWKFGRVTVQLYGTG
jgi:mannosyltransferase